MVHDPGISDGNSHQKVRYISLDKRNGIYIFFYFPELGTERNFDGQIKSGPEKVKNSILPLLSAQSKCDKKTLSYIMLRQRSALLYFLLPFIGILAIGRMATKWSVNNKSTLFRNVMRGIQATTIPYPPADMTGV